MSSEGLFCAFLLAPQGSSVTEEGLFISREHPATDSSFGFYTTTHYFAVHAILLARECLLHKT